MGNKACHFPSRAKCNIFKTFAAKIVEHIEKFHLGECLVAILYGLI